ncbi:sigma-70 family RNA polymerase sigma factor [Streptomyces sp. NPDC019224]|uniref:RNA polymerase sigma factor n=1 Tax=Streptomyces sp. NPDC019224 TaxID=3154484 RepID=UPI0033FEA266
MVRRGAPRAAGVQGRNLAAEADVGLIRTVLVLGGVPWADLEDGVQQVRLKLLESGARSASGAIRSPEAWVSVVASRVALDWHRDRSKDTGLTERLTRRWEQRPPVGHPEDDRLLALAVAAGLDELTAQQRQVLTLRYYADLTVRDIAAEVGIPEGTVKSRLHHALAALEDRLRDREVI